MESNGIRRVPTGYFEVMAFAMNNAAKDLQVESSRSSEVSVLFYVKEMEYKKSLRFFNPEAQRGGGIPIYRVAYLKVYYTFFRYTLGIYMGYL